MFIGSNTVNTAFRKLSLYTPKDVLVLSPDRDSAEVVAQAIRDEIEVRDHIDTGKMINSISVSKKGDEYAVKGVSYTKYVNGYDREIDGAGFIDDAVNSAILDGYEAETMI